MKSDITFTFFYYSLFSDLGAKSVSDLEKDRFSYASLGQVTVIIFLMYNNDTYYYCYKIRYLTRL